MTITCFGEALLRLTSAPGARLLDGGSLGIHVGGAELNTASALAAYGEPARFVSRLPDNPLGRGIFATIRGRGIDCSGLGYGEGRLGLYFQVPGSDLRGSEITYDREGSAFAAMTPADLDIDAALDGADWVHISGVTLALGPEVADAAIALAEAAAARDLKVSFDFNHRAKLWARWNGDPRPYLKRITACATLLFGNDYDLMKVLDEPEARATRSLTLADRALALLPRLEAVTSAYRRVERDHRHVLRAEIVTPTERHLTEETVLESVIDRVGGGDAYAAGMITALRKEHAPADALGLAFGSMVLKHGWRGDATRSSWADVQSFDVSASGDVKR